jgi:hypothetical protein
MKTIFKLEMYEASTFHVRLSIIWSLTKSFNFDVSGEVEEVKSRYWMRLIQLKTEQVRNLNSDKDNYDNFEKEE